LQWPSLCAVCEAPNGQLMGYILGKAEGQGKLWHGHGRTILRLLACLFLLVFLSVVTAVTVSPDYRRLGIASRLMNFLEEGSAKSYNAYFVDLFVRCSNVLAQIMYTGLGYTVYRRVIEYYSGQEDAFDMRKALARDVKKESMIPLDHPVKPEDLEW
jgi:N-terminal acetyltransferase B complex catalytic subunit